jgi:hypothetical protein
MINILNLIPAYGRDYKSKKALLLDWNSGREFQVFGTFTYINQAGIRSLARDGITEVRFQYLRRTRLHIIEIGVADEKSN